jgi:hypothetical protein
VKNILRIILSLIITIILGACAKRATLQADTPLGLADVTQNFVSVHLALEVDRTGQVWLAGTFTPQKDGYHLYSMTLPRNGLNGEGRPTRLELGIDSKMKAVGDVVESVSAEVASMGPGTLLVYPAGPVTLRLPISLPQGKAWVDDQVSITYEACSDMSCLTPVEGKVVAVRVPTVGMIDR